VKNSTLIIVLVVLILIVDQCIKIWVKTNMLYGEMIPILGWDRALIHFVENEGMAFGKRFDIPYGKLILSLFRIVAAAFLVFFLRSLIREHTVKRGLLISFALILAGALGNIIDSAFYGMLFSASFAHGLPAEFLPPGGGYSTFLHGRVVDMFYFPLFEIPMPGWFPWLGGETLLFFGPVFNLADVAISLGVAQILFFHRGFFQNQPAAHKEEALSHSEEDQNLE
jgi:signal peptidase II